MLSIPITKSPVRFVHDPTRVIAKTFIPGGFSADGHTRVQRVLSRILALPESEISATLSSVQERFSRRHHDLQALFAENFAIVADDIPQEDALSADRQQLIGAYFTHEYSIEAAALTNPSIVPAPSQDGLAPGEQRFVLSLRGIGEGHISSIQFRSGVIDRDGQIRMEPPSRYAGTASHRPPLYDLAMFRAKLQELGADNDRTGAVLGALPPQFTLQQLEAITGGFPLQPGSDPGAWETTRMIHWLALSNYESSFTPESPLVGPTDPSSASSPAAMLMGRFLPWIRWIKAFWGFRRLATGMV